MRGLHLARFALPVLFAAIACDEGFEDPVSIPRPEGLQARFVVGGEATPQFLDIPFPSDVYMQNGRFGAVPGLSRVFARNTALLEQQLAKTNGWSRIASVMFLVDDPTAPADPDTGEKPTVVVDIDSLPVDEEACKSDASSIFLIDFETGARVPCRGIVTDGSDSGNRSFLGIGPARGVVLEEGHKYVAVMTNRVRAGGQRIVATDDFKAAAAGQGPLGSIYGPAYAKVMSSIGGALGSDEVVAIAPYTTQSVSEELFVIRDALEAAPAPVLKWDAASLAPMQPAKFTSVTPLPAGFTASLDEWLGIHPGPKLPDGSDDTDYGIPVRAHDKMSVVATAVFDAVNYLSVRDQKYDDVDHATFARDASGNPIPAPEKPTSKIWVTFAVPNVAPPAGGYPVVIMQHGLGGSREHLLEYANRFCAMGWMAVAIDSVTFGARANDPRFVVDAETDYQGQNGATYAGPDGISDLVATSQGSAQKQRAGSTDLFGGLKNIRALGDQIRHAGLDTAQLVKVLRSNPDLSGLDTGSGAPTIDPEKIVYVGDSLGGIEGAIAAAVEPHVKAWVLNVPGGGLVTELAAHGPSIHANLALAGGANFGLTTKQYTEGHPLTVLGQTLGEAGDPIAYASRLVTSPRPIGGLAPKRNVLMVEVVYDEIVSNEATEALARAAGLALGTPNVGPNSGVADLATNRPYPGGGIVLPTVDPGPTGFRDTPSQGVTAVLLQVSPGHHGANMIRSSANRTWAIPFNTPSGGLNLVSGDPKRVPCSHNELKNAVVRFFDEAMQGLVPTVTGVPAPVRDVDADGAADATDKAPLDSAAQ